MKESTCFRRQSDAWSPISETVANLTPMVPDVEAGPTTTVTAFGDRLAEAVERKRSQLLVGLDPMPELLPIELAGEAALGRSQAADACTRFCCGVIDAVAAYAVGVKPQLDRKSTRLNSSH